MAIRLSGLNSGMDTDSIVQALMSAQRYKQTKIEAKQTKLEWKKEIWGELNTKIYSFYKDSLAKIKQQGSFKTKAANSSDTSKVTATAGTAAAEGTYKVKVDSLASAQYVTSAKLAGAKNADGNTVKVTSKTKLTDLLDASGNNTFTEGTQISVKGADGTASVVVGADTTVADFVAACKTAGLSASFDENQQRFFISSSTSGADQSFTISCGALSQTQQDAVAGWKESVGYTYLSSTDKATVSAIFDNLQAGTVSSDVAMSSLQKYVEKSQSTAVESYYKNQLTNNYNAQYFSDADCTQVTAAGEAALLASGKAQADIDAMTDADKAKAVKALVTKNVTADLKTTTYTDKIADGIENGIADVSAGAFLNASASARLTALESCVTNYNSVMSNVTSNNTQLAGLGLEEVTGAEVAEKADHTGMVVVAASDASITFNGATLTSSTSNLSVNGLTLDIMGETLGEEITISVTKDTSAVYDSIKDFIGEYNSILKEMNTKYNASSAKGYDVLTDEQKEAMTDDEVEKWETKIKDSLLRRDSTVSTLIASFRNNMTGTYTASDGKRYSFASLGITTSADYREGGLLHIHGDEDDAEYADSTNKLEKLLNEDPDLVMEIFTNLTTNLYNDLQKKMSSTTMSSALTFYNDKEMSSQLSDYKTEISKWEEKLQALEDRYYAQFTAMESAMAKLNSQQSYFSNMFG